MRCAIPKIEELFDFGEWVGRQNDQSHIANLYGYWVCAASSLNIYKGKIFIGSFGCRNDCLAVHFICHKRRDFEVPPSGSTVL